jgi:hypothetical protein
VLQLLGAFAEREEKVAALRAKTLAQACKLLEPSCDSIAPLRDAPQSPTSSPSDEKPECDLVPTRRGETIDDEA